MSAQHTPGPWAVDSEGGRPIVVNEETTFTVAAIRSGFDGDARLIAAAPELLEISRLLSILTEEGEDRMYGVYVKDGVVRAKGSTLDLIEKARAAIAKATGSAA